MRIHRNPLHKIEKFKSKLYVSLEFNTEMRTASTDLFHLVQSMTDAEKKFFRGYIRQFQEGKVAKSMQLFNLVCKQETYDELSLKASMKPRLTDNQFAVCKHYLYQTLLKALSAYLGDQGAMMEVRQHLRMVEVLYHKELLGQCEKVLARAMELAEECGHPLLLAEVMEWQGRIWNKQQFEGVTPSMLDKFYGQLTSSAEKISQYQHLNQLHTRFMHLIRTHGFLRTPEEAQREFAEILGHQALAAPMEGFVIVATYHHIWSIYHLMSGNPEQALSHLRTLVLETRVNPKMYYDYFEFFVSIQYNFGIACLMLDRYPEVLVAIKNLEGLQAAFVAQKARIFHCLVLLRVEYYMGTCQFQEALQVSEEGAAELRRHAKHLSANEYMAIAFTLAFNFFTHGQYQTCKRILLQHLTPGRLHGNADTQVLVEVLRLLVYFELKEDDLFVQSCRSLYRFVNKHRPRYLIESHLLQAIRRYPLGAEPKVIQAFFQGLYDEMVQLAADPLAKRTLQTARLDFWVKAKAEGIPMAEVVRAHQLATTQPPT